MAKNSITKVKNTLLAVIIAVCFLLEICETPSLSLIPALLYRGVLLAVMTGCVYVSPWFQGKMKEVVER